ncbi:BAM_G0034060.mRNA.1.CDS.1 [Saccharomyces cerevisiae]|nr:BAM_G0034060.mRNA.1.CDS.1 [Saccharomyces cerevisiae]CAI7212124.1 BAM_G0034060.mRNA.1.CDS.1 [Saccharomyces cerevisiae]
MKPRKEQENQTTKMLRRLKRLKLNQKALPHRSQALAGHRHLQNQNQILNQILNQVLAPALATLRLTPTLAPALAALPRIQIRIPTQARLIQVPTNLHLLLIPPIRIPTQTLVLALNWKQKKQLQTNPRPKKRLPHLTNQLHLLPVHQAPIN